MELRSAEQRRRRNREGARRAILGAAAAILVEDGHENFSMRRLAARCGYTAPTIYHYFGDKAGLIDALLEESFRQLLSHLRRVRRGDDPVDDMRAMFRAFVRFGLRNATQYWLLTMPRDGQSAPPEAAEEARALLEEPLLRIESEGRLLADDIETVRQSFWALLHGLITLQTSRPDHAWTKDLLETSLESMISGFVETRENGEDRT